MQISNYIHYSRNFLKEAAQSYELSLQKKWNKLNKSNVYKSTDGRTLKILSQGIWNRESGPDFLNAKILLDDIEKHGDIEIHFSSSDWFRHGHDKDNAYDNVVLHVLAEADMPSPNIPAFIIPESESENRSVKRKLIPGKCSSLFQRCSDKELINFLSDAALERFKIKSDLILTEMLEEGACTVFQKLVFEAMGYKNNRKAFLELFEKFNSYSEQEKMKNYEAILWGESGLLPDPATIKLNCELCGFIGKTWKKWWKIRKTSENNIIWYRKGQRPQNSPERRVAGLIEIISSAEGKLMDYFLKLFEELLNKEDENPALFIKRLTVHHPLWDYYSTFNSNRNKKASAVIGRSRILHILINVILPAVNAFYRLHADNKSANFAENFWKELPKEQNNAVLKRAFSKFGLNKRKKLLKKAVSQQGIFHLYKNFCEINHSDCSSCRMIKNEI